MTYRRKISPWSSLGLVLAVVLLLLGLIGIDLIIATTSRERGERHGYALGYIEGRAETCAHLLDQMRWAQNVMQNLVESGRSTADVKKMMLADHDAQMRYACDMPMVTTANAFDPSLPSPVFALVGPTLPVSKVATGNPRSLLAGLPSPKPTPQPAPPPSPTPTPKK